VPKGLSKVASELNIPIEHNSFRQSVQFDDTIEKNLATFEASDVQSKAEISHLCRVSYEFLGDLTRNSY